MNLKNPYVALFNVGVQNTLISKDQDKIVKMVNVFILFWYHAFIMMSSLTVLFRGDYGGSLILNCCGLIFMMLCHLLNKYHKFTLASIGVLCYTMFHYYMLTNFFAPERFVEFFYLIVPCGALMFFRKEIYSWVILGVAIIMFHIPFYYLGAYQYEGVLFLPPVMVFLFIANFMIVLYFKKLNNKNEQLLDEEKKKVVSDKKLIENQHESLEELSRFKDKFFINLSHEIRTPLTLIHGNINQIEPTESQMKTVESLKSNIASITTLVNDVLDLAKIEEQGLSLDLATISVNECLSKQFNMFTDLFAQKKISFELFLETEEVYIDIDRLYFERAINNILNNAHKYTPENGKVTLSAVLSGDKLEISISDTGIGIPQDMLSNVFNRFEQVDNDINKMGGSGIGLSFADQVIKAHNGSIGVVSTEGTGTIFTITLPESEVISKDNDEEITKIQVSGNGKSEVIFIVEDNKEIGEYIKRLFGNDDCYLFSDGVEALRAIPAHNPSCIISDYMMPNMNGYELIENIRDKGYKIPTIILTANTDEKTKIDVLRLGVDDYLTKPFNEEELRLKVKRLIYNNNQRIKYVVENDEIIDGGGDDFLKKLDVIIIEHLESSRFNTDDMASMMSVSNSTLLRKVKSLTGLSPKQYTLTLKLQKAREYFEKKPSASLKEVAYSVGISNQSRFAKQYEEHFGKKPGLS